ncbi:hypothetical protein JCM6882_003502 [Rhodosporidiobolus microsporus]
MSTLSSEPLPASRLPVSQDEQKPIQTTSNTLDATAPGDVAHPSGFKEEQGGTFRPPTTEGQSLEERERIEKEGGQGSLEKVTSGLGGMVLNAPLAAVEKVSPSLAHNVQETVSSLAHRAQDYAGQAKEATTSASTSAGESASAPVIRPGGEVTQSKTDTAVEKTAAAGSGLAETASHALEAVKSYIPSSLSGQLGSVTTSIPPFTVVSSEDVPTSKEAAQTREGVVPPQQEREGETATATALGSEAPPAVEGLAGYAHVAAEKVREIGNKAAEYLPSGEQQQKTAESVTTTLGNAATTAGHQAAVGAAIAGEKASQATDALKSRASGMPAVWPPEDGTPYSTLNVTPVTVGATPLSSITSTASSTYTAAKGAAAAAAGTTAAALATAKDKVASALPSSAPSAAQNTLDSARESSASAIQATHQRATERAERQEMAEALEPGSGSTSASATAPANLATLRGDSAYSESEGGGTATILRDDHRDTVGRGFGDERLRREPEVADVGGEAAKRLLEHGEAGAKQNATSTSQGSGSAATFAAGDANPAGSDRVSAQSASLGGTARFVPGQEKDAQPVPASHADTHNLFATSGTAGFAALAAGGAAGSDSVRVGSEGVGHTGGANVLPHSVGVEEQGQSTKPLPPDVDFTSTGSPHTYSATHASPSSAATSAPAPPQDLTGRGSPHTYSSAHDYAVPAGAVSLEEAKSRPSEAQQAGSFVPPGEQKQGKGEWLKGKLHLGREKH